MTRATLLVLSAVALSGCYTYRPLAQPEAGQTVRLLLNADGTDRLARVLGPRIAELDGRITQVRADSLHFEVRTARTSDLIESYFKDDAVVLPQSAISSIMARRLAPGPTIALGGLAVAGAVGAAVAVGDGSSNASPPPGGPVSPD